MGKNTMYPRKGGHKQQSLSRKNRKVSLTDLLTMTVKSMATCTSEARKYISMGNKAERDFQDLAYTQEAIDLFGGDDTKRIELYRTRYIIYYLALKQIGFCTPKSAEDWDALKEVLQSQLAEGVKDADLGDYDDQKKSDLISALYVDVSRGKPSEDKTLLKEAIEKYCDIKFKGIPTLDADPILTDANIENMAGEDSDDEQDETEEVNG